MKPMRQRRSRMKERSMISYDLETTAITEGTPTPLYISIYDGETCSGFPTKGFGELHSVVCREILTDENIGKRFIAYNGNRFDAYLIARSMMTDSAYRIEPWLAKNHSFRGMAIYDTDNRKRFWFFSDPMNMFGYLGSLESFLSVYAPNYHKQHIDIMHFDNTNPEHIEYAKNDSIALWHAATNAGASLKHVTGIPAQNTIGKTAVKFFESKMPKDALVWRVPQSAERSLILAKRGGYVYCRGRYRGNIWKYDLNQAYAAAMKEPLPSGRCVHTSKYKAGKLGLYLCTIYRYEHTPVPFYIRDASGVPHTTHGETVTGWILSPEIDFLLSTGWDVLVQEGWYWTDRFNMREMVNELEHARIHCEGGPKGALGLMYKAVGNNAYGKTLEDHDGLRIVFAAECPDGYHAYQAESPEYDYIWIKKDDKHIETYHRPQIGIFITAYVRIWIMESALTSPDTFLYADTDCVAFSTDVSEHLWLDAGKYGAFKVEVFNEEFIFINKKVYCSITEHPKKPGIPLHVSAKGLHIAGLTVTDFERWYDGHIPKQTQTQRQNILKVMANDPMFIDRERMGSFVLLLP